MRVRRHPGTRVVHALITAKHEITFVEHKFVSLVSALSPYSAPDSRAADGVGSADPRDPVLSPLYSDLSGFPPTLFITSTRDVVLSATTILHRAFLRAGVDAQLIVFEALPHAFWHNPDLPESKEANKFMAGFFSQHLGR
jgi:epsilon-lactone hydrolase